MNTPWRIEVFGRTLTFERRADGWQVCHVGADGKRRPADDIRVPGTLALAEVPGFLADLCHEWARPGRDRVDVTVPPLFVYGTLREGYPNASRLDGRRRAGRYVTVERWPLVLAGERRSPCLLTECGAGEAVVGELHDVALAGFGALDALERVGQPDGYRRRRIVVRLLGIDDSGTIAALSYMKARQHAPAPHLGPLEEYLPEHALDYRPRR